MRRSGAKTAWRSAHERAMLAEIGAGAASAAN